MAESNESLSTLRVLLAKEYERISTYKNWAGMFKEMLRGGLDGPGYNSRVSDIIVPKLQEISDKFKEAIAADGTLLEVQNWALEVQKWEKQLFESTVTYQKRIVSHISAGGVSGAKHDRDNCLFFLNGGDLGEGAAVHTCFSLAPSIRERMNWLSRTVDNDSDDENSGCCGKIADVSSECLEIKRDILEQLTDAESHIMNLVDEAKELLIDEVVI